MARLDNYFGEADASVDSAETLTAQHVFRDLEQHVKWGSRSSGKQVVVGVKGSGKTELRRHLESQTDSYVLNFDADHAYFSQDVSTIGEPSGRTKNAVATILIREFARRFSESQKSKTATALKKALDVSTSIVKQVPNAIDLTVPGATLKLGALLQRDAASVLQSTLDRLIADVLSALRDAGKVGAILIDDVEDVFSGISDNPLFLEGVARAVADINNHGEERLHAVLFVKHGLWRSWFERPKEYDRVRSVIDFLTWDHDALVELIAKRIAHRRGMEVAQSLEVEALWAREFSWAGKFDTFTRYCTQYCVSGPRDMVTLCNLAAGKPAGDEPITRKHIKASLGAYSEEKVLSLNADFGDTYPDIHKFVEQVFQEASVQMTGKELAELIESRTLLDARFHDEFKSNKQWYPATRARLALIMYQVGVVGYKSPTGMMYAIEKPNLSNSELLEKVVVCVHPAFRPHLNIA
ncbi:P-loop ATPase, Sll1717 family [Streptomyces sp. NPDC001549]|uniref:P-loop ATPase, Sll1717 family n=1 Tax=Streptomyces sp. NPDC001549 TaxID=3364586 RepID=UPI0036C8AAA6